MIRILLLAAFSSFALISQTAPANAQTLSTFVSGDRLKDWCTAIAIDPDFKMKDARCIAFITGVVDSAEVLTNAPGANVPKSFCLPGNIRDFDLKDKVAVEISRDAGLARFPAAGAVLVALRRAYPCN